MESFENLAPSLAALSHPGRLHLFRLLMSRFPDTLPAGEIASIVGLPASTLSTHLATLRREGLLTQARSGTVLRYGIDLRAVQKLMQALIGDCCRGRYDLCLPDLAFPQPGATAMTQRKYNVLFVCSGNSARSIFAESILREIAGDRFSAYSAGLDPKSQLNPFAVDLLRTKGMDTERLRAKGIEEFRGPDAPQVDFVFTVCDSSANEICAPWEGQPITSQWSTEDPVKARGTDAEISLAFQRAYGALRNRIVTFAALPIGQLDRLAIQAAVDDIGRSAAGAHA